LPCGNGPLLGDEQSIFRVQCTRFLKLCFAYKAINACDRLNQRLLRCRT
jgi:hypothetical protein